MSATSTLDRIAAHMAGRLSENAPSVRLVIGEHQKSITAADPSAGQVSVRFDSLDRATDEVAGRVTFDALLRAGQCTVESDTNGASERFIMAFSSGLPSAPYVGEILNRVHGLSNDDALAAIEDEIGIDTFLLTTLRSEGQSLDLRGLADRVGGRTSIRWTILEPTRTTARYTVSGTPAQPICDDDTETAMTFEYAHLTNLLRLTTGEHDVATALGRGTLRVSGDENHLSALVSLLLS